MKKIIFLLAIAIYFGSSAFGQEDDKITIPRKDYDGYLRAKFELEGLQKQYKSLQDSTAKLEKQYKSDTAQLCKQYRVDTAQINKLKKISKENEQLKKSCKNLQKDTTKLRKQLFECQSRMREETFLNNQSDSLVDLLSKKTEEVNGLYESLNNCDNIKKHLDSRLETIEQQNKDLMRVNDSLRNIDCAAGLLRFYFSDEISLYDYPQRDKDLFQYYGDSVPEMLERKIAEVEYLQLLDVRFEKSKIDIALHQKGLLSDELSERLINYYWVCDGIYNLLEKINNEYCKDASSKKKSNPGIVKPNRQYALDVVLKEVVEIEKMYGDISNYPYANNILQQALRQISKDVSDTKAMESLIKKIAPITE